MTESPAQQQWYKSFDVFQSMSSGPARYKWDRKIEFILSCLGFSVGFGNVWRFPYIVYKNGGAAFFIPYTCVLIFMAMPLYFLEVLLGQFTGCNAFAAFNFAPVCKGIPVGSFLVSVYVIIYYVMFLVYSLKYMFASFSPFLPWSKCDQTWGADDKCLLRESISQNESKPLCTGMSEPFVPGRDCLELQTATEQYWKKAILHQTVGDDVYNLDNMGSIQWDLFLVLLLTWITLFCFVIKGIKSSGKAVYVTATFPLLLLVILFCYTLSLDGSVDGLAYLFTPTWANIISGKVWSEAVTQAFYSIDIAFGCVILLASYNDFNDQIQWKVLLVISMDFLASFIASVTVFSILGFLSRILNVDIDTVVDKGPGLLFIAVPEALSHMPIPQLWSAVYFFMLFIVGLDSESVMIDSVITVLYEELPNMRVHRMKVRILVCVFLFVATIPCTTNGGIYWIEFLDTYASDITLTLLALCEILSITYIYGINRFIDDVEFMLGYRLNIFWKIAWMFTNPIILLIMLVIAVINGVGCGDYSPAFCILGWFITTSVIIQVPVWAIYYLIKFSKTEEKAIGAFRPTPKWGPREIVHKLLYLDWQRTRGRTTLPQATTTGLEELDAERTDQVTDLKAVVMGRLRAKRLSMLQKFGTEFHDEEIAAAQSRPASPTASS